MGGGDLPIIGEGVDAPHQIQQQGQPQEEMHGQRQQHGDEEQAQGFQGFETRDDERLAHQGEHANGREAHDPHGDEDHHIVYAHPEVVQGFAGRPGQPRHEIAEHHPHENQRQQLGFQCCLKDVGRHGPGDHLDQVRGAAPLHLLHDMGRLAQGPPQGAGRFGLAGADQVDEQQPGENRQEACDHVQPQGLAADPPEGAAPGHVAHADDDGRQNERHHDHLQSVEEQPAEEIENFQQGCAKQPGFLVRHPADQGGQQQGDGNLPVQGNASDSGKRAFVAHRTLLSLNASQIAQAQDDVRCRAAYPS